MPYLFIQIIIGMIFGAFAGLCLGDEQTPATPAFVSEGNTQVAPPNGPTYIVVPTPADMDALLEKLARPDFVVLDWARYTQLKGAGSAPKPLVFETEALLQSLSLLGNVADADAELRLLLRVHRKAGDSPILPIGLNDQFVQSARAADQDLLVTKLAGGAWGVTLRETGDLEIEITFSARILSRGFERRIILPVPESASTSLDLRFPNTTRELRLGSRPLPLESGNIENERFLRCQAAIGPRSQLEINWVISSAAQRAGYTIDSEMDVRVEQGLIQWESTHQVQVDRGSISELEIKLDPFFNEYKIELDGVPVELDAGEESLFRLSLGAIAKAGDSHRIRMIGVRSLKNDKSLRESLRGIEFPQADRQTGWLTIRTDLNMHAECTPHHGLSEPSSRLGLPRSLQGESPAPSFAYRTRDSSFELGIHVETMKPWVWVDSRNTVRISPTAITNELWLDYQTQRPRPRELQLDLPVNWTLDSIGPDSIIESTTVSDSNAGDPQAPRLIVKLKEQATEGTRFSIHAVCRWSGPKIGDIMLPWVRPKEAVSWTGTCSVYATTDLQVTPMLDETLVRLIEPSEDRQSSTSQPFGSDYAFRFTVRHVQPPSNLHLAVQSEPLRTRTNHEVEIYVDRGNATVLDQVQISIDQGIVQELDLEIPDEVKDHWDIEGLDISHREVITSTSSGPRTRLYLVHPQRDRIRFRIRSRWPVPRLGPGESARLNIQPIIVQGMANASERIALGSTNGLEIQPQGDHWTFRGDDDESLASDRNLPFQRVSDGPELRPISLQVRPASVLRLPEVLISRLWLTSYQLSDGSIGVDLHGFIEHHKGELPIQLPPGSEWRTVRIGESVGELAVSDPTSGNHMITLPRSESLKGVVIQLSYRVPPSPARDDRWLPGFPRQVETLDVAWDVRLPSTQAVLGVPKGWENASHWYWAGYRFRRKPDRDPAQLLNWVENGTTAWNDRAVETAGSTALDPSNRVLFHVTGNVAGADIQFVNLIGLITISSTAILLTSIIAFLSGVPLTVYLLVMGLFSTLAIAFGPTIAVLQILQAGIPGLVLAGITAAVVHWRNPRSITSPTVAATAAVPAAEIVARRSTTVSVPRIKPDNDGQSDSTLIRPRTSSDLAPHLEEANTDGIEDRPVSSIQKG